ncbi:cytochrome P450 [Murinocardiopsis flavida]|uniref:Cytochrome P450 n=1 Tax=Murinocardiopsis flavida TaxID=645275 RepID=A0A2P8D8Y6_9ACTN|nr:cytochrome P450 [Murinocardiopsis flavida]PSK93675.1 cytochrome P450 [Murinocardiopsis flavida]
MPDAPRVTVDPFAPAVRAISDPHPAHALMRAAGPLVRADAPDGGGPVWVVTDHALAREVCVHPGIVKDPAYAPPGWEPGTGGLEPTAAEQPSLTTLDGPAHTLLRRAHTLLFTARRMDGYTGRIATIARELLTGLTDRGATVDLMADFTTRYPLAVVSAVLGVPADRIDQAVAACRRMHSEDPEDVAAAMAGFAELAAAALHGDADGLAAELRERLPDGYTEAQLHYLIFTLVFAGQLTTDVSLGFLIADVLGSGHTAADDAGIDAVVRESLRRHPPAPFTLWRYTATDVELAGVPLPPRSPVLVDIRGINTDPARPDGPDLTFGAGPHYCTGAQLAQVELRVLVDVLRIDFPDARLAVPHAELRQRGTGGILGSRLTALPVALRG